MDTAKPGTYQIDAGRSVISFRTRHLFGLGAVRGTLSLNEGQIRVGEQAGSSAVRAAIDAASFHTGNPGRDRTVLSRRLLDAGRHPVMTFSSGQLTEAGGQWILHGSLTVAGHARPVELAIEEVRTDGAVLTAGASTDIDRYAFGVTAMKGLAARHLSCRVEIVAMRRDDDGHRG